MTGARKEITNAQLGLDDQHRFRWVIWVCEGFHPFFVAPDLGQNGTSSGVTFSPTWGYTVPLDGLQMYNKSDCKSW